MKNLIFCSLLLCSNLYGSVTTAFDIGTGKIKMQVAHIDRETRDIESIFCRAEHVGVSILNADGAISLEGRERILSILKSLKLDAERMNATEFYGIATELYRKAPNGEAVIQFLTQATGIQIRVISQEEEGILAFRTVVKEAKVDPETAVVWDIGSGSFQITCKDDGRYIVYTSPYGRYQMLKLLQTNGLSTVENNLQLLPDCIVKKLERNSNRVVGVGAHPKRILSQTNCYSQQDVESMLVLTQTQDIDKSDLILALAVMRCLSIHEVQYRGSAAGNTTGVLLTHLD